MKYIHHWKVSEEHLHQEMGNQLLQNKIISFIINLDETTCMSYVMDKSKSKKRYFIVKGFCLIQLKSIGVWSENTTITLQNNSTVKKSHRTISVIKHQEKLCGIYLTPAVKWLNSWLSCMLFFLVFCHFTMWCSGSGVLLDCIYSWPLPSSLLLPFPMQCPGLKDQCIVLGWLVAH